MSKWRWAQRSEWGRTFQAWGAVGPPSLRAVSCTTREQAFLCLLFWLCKEKWNTVFKGQEGLSGSLAWRQRACFRFLLYKMPSHHGWVPCRGRKFPRVTEGAGSGNRAVGRLHQKPVLDRSSSGPRQPRRWARERPSSGVLSLLSLFP